MYKNYKIAINMIKILYQILNVGNKLKFKKNRLYIDGYILNFWSIKILY